MDKVGSVSFFSPSKIRLVLPLLCDCKRTSDFEDSVRRRQVIGWKWRCVTVTFDFEHNIVNI